MQWKLISERSGAILCRPMIPAGLADYLLPGSSWQGAGWPCGELLNQEWEGEPAIRYTQFLFYQDDCLRITEDHPRVIMHVILKNDFTGDWGGLGHRDDHRWTCNMMQLPSLDYTFAGHPGQVYSQVDFCYSEEHLSAIASEAPLLQQLLLAREQGLPALLFPDNRPVAANILARIGEILLIPRRDEYRNRYAAVRSIEVLMDTLFHHS